MKVIKRTFCGLAGTCLGWLLIGTPVATGASFGVSLDSHGAAGDACIGTYAAEEAFGSGSLNSSTFVQYSGSAVGLDNGWPGPPGSNLTGCQFSPVFAHVSGSGEAQPGLLRASASADMETVGLIQAGADTFVSYFDTLTLGGGTYLFTFTFTGDLSATPSCPGGNAATAAIYNVQLTGIHGIIDRGFWSNNECSPDSPPSTNFGGGLLINNHTLQYTISASAGSTVGVSASLEARAGAGFNQSAVADFGSTAILDVTGVNGATYSSDSGTVFNFQDSPEPASWLLAVCGLASIFIARAVYSRAGADGGWTVRRRRRA